MTIAFKIVLRVGLVAELSQQAHRGALQGHDLPWSVGRHSFALCREQVKRCFRLRNADADILVGDDKHGWTVSVTLRAVFLAVQHASDAVQMAFELAEAFGEPSIERPEGRVRRLDLCADVAGISFAAADAANFVGRVRTGAVYRPRQDRRHSPRGANDDGRHDTRKHARQHADDVERWRTTGYTFAAGNPIMMRLYDKTEELEVCQGEDSEKWGTETEAWRAAGWDGAARVWRCEPQLRGKAIEQLGIRDPLEMVQKLDALWRYLVGEIDGDDHATRGWLRLTRDDATRRERRSTDPRWVAFQRAVFEGSKPIKRVHGRRGGMRPAHALGAVLSALGASSKIATTDDDDVCTGRELLSRDLVAFRDLIALDDGLVDRYPVWRAATVCRFAALEPPAAGTELERWKREDAARKASIASSTYAA